MMLADESDVSKRQEDGFGFWACIFPIVLCGWFSFVQFAFLIFLIISKFGLWLLADLAPWQAVIALSSLATGLSSPHGQGEGRQLITRKERQQSNKIESVSAVSRCLGSFLDSDMEFTLSSQIQIFLCLIATVLLMGSMDAFPCPLKWYWSLHIFLRSNFASKTHSFFCSYSRCDVPGCEVPHLSVAPSRRSSSSWGDSFLTFPFHTSCHLKSHCGSVVRYW